MPSGTGGRPTKYRDEYPQFAAVLRAQGYTEANVAEVLRIGASTLSDWKLIYPEFADALDVEECRGRAELPDARSFDPRRSGEGFRQSKVEEYRGPRDEFPEAQEESSEERPRTVARLEQVPGHQSIERKKPPPRTAIL